MINGHAPPGPGAAPARCAACKAPLADGGDGYCDRPVCRTRARVADAGEIARRQAESERRGDALAQARTGPALRQAAARIGASDPADIAVSRVPHIDPAVAAPPPAATGALLRHLADIIARSFDPDGAPDPPRGHEAPPGEDFARWDATLPEEPPALHASCAACQGECCLQGRRSHAFLTTRTIDWYRRRNPDATAAGTLAHYLSYLPKETVQRSCLYHGPRGCALPRTLRAEICNRYQCRWRARLAAEIAEKGGERVVAVGLARDHAEHPEAGAPYLRVVTYSEGGLEVHGDLTLTGTPPEA